MNESGNPFRLFDRWRRRADDSMLSEPADVGTAFGLELSMLPDDEPSATACTGAPGGTEWWRRLTRWTSN
ncbi:MAG: hypothetical protein IPI03_12045 [Rubrivivax sp.]|jgi:hypothetical protein|nr:hypothetical protein [Rubrivivax sp.]MBK7262545.1 hypothetical protein [Rubrivivax sp.]MBK8527604.1 hypothetical protein [Rubrivivax sp.]